MYYDIHCHIFNKAIIDKRMDVLLSPAFKLIDGLEEKLPEKILTELVEKGDNFLTAFMKMDSAEVFSQLDEHYNHEFVLTPLMMDLEFTDSENLAKYEIISQRVWKEVTADFIVTLRNRLAQISATYPKLAGGLKKLSSKKFIWVNKLVESERVMFEQNNFQNQIDDLEKLARQCKRLRPFLGLDARRSGKQNLNQLIKEKILDEGALFAGIKLYAPTGFSPTDPALFGKDGVYELCEKFAIPITVHCSSEGFSTHVNSVKINGLVYMNKKLVQMDNEIVRFDIPFFSLGLKAAIQERALTLNHPKIWRKVFEKYPNLKLNLAHLGGKIELMKFTNYEIEKKKLTSNEFSALLSLTETNETRKLLETCFLKKELRIKGKSLRTVYVLNNSIDPVQKEQLWNALYYLGWQESWSKTILDILKDFPNAYTDLSCFSSGQSIEGVFSIQESLSTFKKTIYDNQPDSVKDKILYGSDFFFVLLFGPTMENYIAEFKAVFAEEFDRIASRNPERFLSIKKTN